MDQSITFMNMHSSMVPGLLPARFLISALLPLIQEICNDKTEEEIPLFIVQLYEYLVAQWLLWLVLSKEGWASIEQFWLTVGGTQQCIKYLIAQWLLWLVLSKEGTLTEQFWLTVGESRYWQKILQLGGFGSCWDMQVSLQVNYAVDVQRTIKLFLGRVQNHAVAVLLKSLCKNH